MHEAKSGPIPSGLERGPEQNLERGPEQNLEQVTPFFHVVNLEAVVQFFVAGLGFTAHLRTQEYAYVQRDGAGFRLLLRGDAVDYLKADPPAVQRRYAYLDVHDVDGFYAELRPRLTGELRNHPDGPRDQPYGQREFTVFAPEEIVLFIGRMTTPPETAAL